ncbi:MAG: histidine kinase [Betaproteobacteria bacterium]|nr:histidine kinase [Betaproteobacteria bacterium]
MSRILNIAAASRSAASTAQSETRTRLWKVDGKTARRPGLLGWFCVIGFTTLAAFAFTFSIILSHFVTHEILSRDAILINRFIVNVSEMRRSGPDVGPHVGQYVSVGQSLEAKAQFVLPVAEEGLAADDTSRLYDYLRFVPDAVYVHVFARNRTIIWSTDAAMIGQAAQDNPELDRAFASPVALPITNVRRVHNAEEPLFAHRSAGAAVEDYVSLRDVHGEVAAVAQIVREPAGLADTIDEVNLLVGSCTALGAVILFMVLFWFLRRADLVLTEQRRRLDDAGPLCAIGEMSVAVVHGIRNPLAAIRSSAEVALDGDAASVRKNAMDIIAQADRLGDWVRDLLTLSQSPEGGDERLDLVTMTERTLLGFARQFEQRAMTVNIVRPSAKLPSVAADRRLATQALANVIANALEAMPDAGFLRVEFEHAEAHKRLRVIVTDSGPGISPTELELVFKPYYTTKRDGLGLGMALVERIMERCGGAINLRSREGEGTQVSLTFRVA